MSADVLASSRPFPVDGFFQIHTPKKSLRLVRAIRRVIFKTHTLRLKPAIFRWWSRRESTPAIYDAISPLYMFSSSLDSETSAA